MKLLPCPFCGTEARIVLQNAASSVECSGVKCFARTPYLHDAEESPAQWAKRAIRKRVLHLKTCPLCGAEAVERYPAGCPSWYYVECAACGLRTLSMQSRDAAITHWNREHGQA
ncbi:MAG: Lar family restriction alleviation protein [Fluviibacter sp.]